MGLLDSILGAMSGKSDASDKVGPLIGVLSGLLTQSGGLQGLANKYSQSGQGNTFSSWVGMGENQPISENQIQNVLGPSQRAGRKDGSGSRPSLALFGRIPAKDCRQTNAGWKSGPHGGPPAGFDCLASVALAECSGPIFQRSVRGGIRPPVRYSRCRGGKLPP